MARRGSGNHEPQPSRPGASTPQPDALRVVAPDELADYQRTITLSSGRVGQLHLITRSDWNACLQGEETAALLYCPVQHPAPIGSMMQVDVRFEGGPSVVIEGRVCWRRPTSRDRRFQTAVKLSLAPPERPKVRYLNAYAAGLLEDRRDGARRHQLSMAVAYTDAEGRHLTWAHDVGARGFSMRHRFPPAVGWEQNFSLLFPGGSAGIFRLIGRVARHIRRESMDGMGVRLLFRTASEKLAFSAALAVAAAETPEGAAVGATAIPQREWT